MTFSRQPAREPRAASPEEHYWEHIPDAFGGVEDISDTLICREQQQFFLTDRDGNVPAKNGRGLGLYSRDTRHLSVYDFAVEGVRPMVLLSTADSGFSQEQILGNHRVIREDSTVIGRATIEFRRERVVDGCLEERLSIANFNPFPIEIRPAYYFDADFADIFEIRGHTRQQQGRHSPPEVTKNTILYRYLGMDGVWRRTLIVFDQEPDEIDAHSVTFKISLGPRELTEIRFRVLFEETPERPSTEAPRRLEDEYAAWHASFAKIETDNEGFNHVLRRSISDLRLLWTKDAAGLGYVAAGTPWYATLFGRDSAITALQTLPFRPALARECLALLARYQGQIVAPAICEEPGKILHEVREDELSAIGELPYKRYFGSVDSTPLFLLLAAEYFHWTADKETLTSLLPAINAALRWLREFGDRDGDGFVEYATNSSTGLRNQAWKDSAEAVMHEDGTLCEGPIAAAEVQGYIYLAYTRLAPVLEALGQSERADELRRAAEELRRRFNEAFWLADRGYVALALDGEKRPSEVSSSNSGQVLWSGILSRSRASAVRGELFSEEMFSGWGVRTLSTAARTYYPLGYHVGTVWPHDNAIVANGLKRYGFDEDVNRIATGLFDAARAFPNFRLPELFGGQPRTETRPPVPYPVACRPQAWTAGAMLHTLQAMLGLFPDASRGRLYVIRPKLPPWLRSVSIEGLSIGAGRVDLRFTLDASGKTAVSFEVHGRLDVVQSTSWRLFEHQD